MSTHPPRAEYPRPHLVRNDTHGIGWLCLNGDWAFRFGDPEGWDGESAVSADACDRQRGCPGPSQGLWRGSGARGDRGCRPPSQRRGCRSTAEWPPPAEAAPSGRWGQEARGRLACQCWDRVVAEGEPASQPRYCTRPLGSPYRVGHIASRVRSYSESSNRPGRKCDQVPKVQMANAMAIVRRGPVTPFGQHRGQAGGQYVTGRGPKAPPC